MSTSTNTSFTEMIMTQRVARPPVKGGRGPWSTRGGLFDLVLVISVVLVVISRTPAGALVRYVGAVVTSEDAELPSLTAYFSSESSFVTPSVAEIEALPPEPTPPPADDPTAVPEPWRSAVRASLSSGLPPALRDSLVESGRKPTPDQAMLKLDEMWAEHENPEVVLELATFGKDMRERAIARALAAGEWEPERYEGHRRYLASALTREGDRFVAGTMALATALDLAWPVRRPYRVGSKFGWRIHPILKRRRFHNGVDIPLEEGHPILAAQAGRVELMGNSRTSGKYVVLDHGAGVRTSYSHLSAHSVKWGQTVEKGQEIGKSGNTGLSTGPHLHYNVRIGGRSVNPQRFEPAEEEVGAL